MTSALGPVLVVGTGLIGTSVGLALCARGVDVWLEDTDEAALEIARASGAGRRLRSDDPPASLAVVAVPPLRTGSVVADLLMTGKAQFATDVASVKSAPARDVAARGAEVAARYVGGHPMAGREVAGPRGARADLFDGRRWVLCPGPTSHPGALDQATTLALLVGATPLVMPAEDHDVAVALVSHAPHVVAALIAGRLTNAPEHEVRLAGPGITDVTRIAGGDPALWTEILAANAGAVAAVLTSVRKDLDDVVAILDRLASSGVGLDSASLAPFLQDGVRGRGRLPGKHDARAEDFVEVQVQIEDRPGQLALLFADTDAAGVNVEDVHIDHVPGRRVGVVQLAVRPAAGPLLMAQLRMRGWIVDE